MVKIQPMSDKSGWIVDDKTIPQLSRIIKLSCNYDSLCMIIPWLSPTTSGLLQPIVGESWKQARDMGHLTSLPFFTQFSHVFTPNKFKSLVAKEPQCLLDHYRPYGHPSVVQVAPRQSMLVLWTQSARARFAWLWSFNELQMFRRFRVSFRRIVGLICFWVVKFGDVKMDWKKHFWPRRPDMTRIQSQQISRIATWTDHPTTRGRDINMDMDHPGSPEGGLSLAICYIRHRSLPICSCFTKTAWALALRHRDDSLLGQHLFKNQTFLGTCSTSLLGAGKEWMVGKWNWDPSISFCSLRISHDSSKKGVRYPSIKLFHHRYFCTQPHIIMLGYICD